MLSVLRIALYVKEFIQRKCYFVSLLTSAPVLKFKSLPGPKNGQQRDSAWQQR